MVADRHLYRRGSTESSDKESLVAGQKDCDKGHSVPTSPSSIDISQLQAKLKFDVENSVVSARNQNPQLSWEPKPSRCLLLSLTSA